LKDNDHQARALETLEALLSKAGALGVEPLLTILSNIQANEQLLHQSATVNGRVVPCADAQLLERLLKKWLFTKCKVLSSTSEENLRFHEELFRRILLRSTTLPRAKIFTLNYDL